MSDSRSDISDIHLTHDQRSKIKDMIDSDLLWEAKEAIVRILEEDRRQRYEKGLRV